MIETVRSRPVARFKVIGHAPGRDKRGRFQKRKMLLRRVPLTDESAEYEAGIVMLSDKQADDNINKGRKSLRVEVK